MFCQKCGADAGDNNFCPQCGAQVTPVDLSKPAMQGNPVQVLVFGILGLALGSLGIIGLVFSIVGLNKANNYIGTYGDVSNMVRHGRRLSIGGLVYSIVMTVFWFFYFFMLWSVISKGVHIYY